MNSAIDARNQWQDERGRFTRHPEASATPENAGSWAPHHFFAVTIHKSFRLSLFAVGLGACLWGWPVSGDADGMYPEHETGTGKGIHHVDVAPSRLVEDVPVQNQWPAPDVPSSAESSFMRNADVEATGQRDPIVRPRPRNVTPREASLARARELITQQFYAQAVTVLAPLFVTPPHTWESWFWLGTAQLGLGQWAKARASFMEGLARDAAVPQLWVHHALVSQQQGRSGEALESLRQAELVAPQLPAVQLNLAYSLEVQGAESVAVEHYRLFLALTKDNHVYNGTREKVRKHLMRLATR